MSVRLQITMLDPGIEPPAPARAGDAGLDLRSAVDATIKPGERAMIPTGLAVAIPPGFAGFVQPRSGLAANSGIGVLNSPGLIDSGYRGQIKVILINLDPAEAFHIARGDRIAQLVVLAVPAVQIQQVDRLPESERGDAGFGSTGR